MVGPYDHFGPSDFDHRIVPLLDQHPTHLFPNLCSVTLFESAAAYYFERLTKDKQNKMVRWFRDLIQLGPTMLAMHHDLVPFIVPDLPAIKSIRKLKISSGRSWDLKAGDLQELTLRETVPQLTSLESFCGDLWSWDVLWHLGQLPALKELSVELPSTPPDIPHHKDGALFSQIKVLNIRATHLSIAELFRCSNFDKLTTFSAEIISPDDSSEIQVLDLIPYHCHQLQSLCLRQHIHLPTDVHKLYPYRNIQVLSIILHARVVQEPWDEDNLVSLTKGLPQLERFYVLDKSQGNLPSPRTAFTLRALLDLVEGCSKLEHICMDFDARQWSQSKYLSRRKKGHAVRNYSVRHLNVCNSAVTSRKRVARILSGLLPCLEVIAVAPYAKDRSGWKSVAEWHRNSPLFRSQTDDAMPGSLGTDEGMTLCTVESLGL